MADNPTALVIVGASLAGLRAAQALRKSGYDGGLTMVGAEDRLPYDRPPLSKEILRGDRDPDTTSLVQNEGMRTLGLDLRLGRRAVALDARERFLTLDDGEQLKFDRLLIATGASPRRLPGTPPWTGIFTLRTLDDCLAIRDELHRGPRVTIVGAGFIGSEVAASCRRLGLEVTVVEALPVPLAHALGSDVGAVLEKVHRDEGVKLRLGVQVVGFEGDGRVEGLRLSDGSDVPADVVVVGIGVVPETTWLAGSDVQTADGVLCDQSCATNVPGVVAAGDVARWYNPLLEETMRVEHWTNAAEQGQAAARRLLSGPEAAEPFCPVPFFWSDQYDLKIRFAGSTTDTDMSRVLLGSLEERCFLKLYGRRGRVVGALAFNRTPQLMACRDMIRDRTTWDEAVDSVGSPPLMRM